MNFNTMTAEQIGEEMDRFQLQIIRQQNSGHPTTEAQKKRLWALRVAYRRAWAIREP